MVAPPFIFTVTVWVLSLQGFTYDKLDAGRLGLFLLSLLSLDLWGVTSFVGLLVQSLLILGSRKEDEVLN